MTWLDGVIRGAIIFLFGALVTHLWNRLRERPTLLRWTTQYVRLAASSDVAFAQVDVLYNGQPVTNLYLANVQLQNESNSDLQDVVVNLACLDGSRVLISEGRLAGSLQTLPFTAFFDQALTDAIETPAQAIWPYLNTRRDYQIPVLNRGAVVSFILLLTRDDALQPEVQLACDHMGVRVVHQPPVWALWGIPMKHGVVTGLILGLALVLLLSRLISSPVLAGLSAWSIGVLSSLIGVGILRTWRWLVRLIA